MKERRWGGRECQKVGEQQDLQPLQGFTMHDSEGHMPHFVTVVTPGKLSIHTDGVYNISTFTIKMHYFCNNGFLI